MSETGPADEVVRGYVMHLFRDGAGLGIAQPGYEHVRQCPDAHVDGEYEASDGVYGCETGCEYARLEARIVCPHGSVNFEYGEFGDLPDLLEGIALWERTRNGEVR